jgi:hypothetical protein
VSVSRTLQGCAARVLRRPTTDLVPASQRLYSFVFHKRKRPHTSDQIIVGSVASLTAAPSPASQLLRAWCLAHFPYLPFRNTLIHTARPLLKQGIATTPTKPAMGGAQQGPLRVLSAEASGGSDGGPAVTACPDTTLVGRWNSRTSDQEHAVAEDVVTGTVGSFRLQHGGCSHLPFTRMPRSPPVTWPHMRRTKTLGEQARRGIGTLRPPVDHEDTGLATFVHTAEWCGCEVFENGKLHSDQDDGDGWLRASSESSRYVHLTSLPNIYIYMSLIVSWLGG